MIASLFFVGQGVRLTATFTADDGVTLLDPTTVTFSVKSPSGVTTTLTGGQVTRVSAGVYQVDVVGSEAGSWYYRAAGTGSAQAAYEGAFRVSSSKF